MNTETPVSNDRDIDSPAALSRAQMFALWATGILGGAGIYGAVEAKEILGITCGLGGAGALIIARIAQKGIDDLKGDNH